jgi:hypothetical protein
VTFAERELLGKRAVAPATYCDAKRLPDDFDQRWPLGGPVLLYRHAFPSSRAPRRSPAARQM